MTTSLLSFSAKDFKSSSLLKTASARVFILLAFELDVPIDLISSTVRQDNFFGLIFPEQRFSNRLYIFPQLLRKASVLLFRVQEIQTLYHLNKFDKVFPQPKK